MKFLNAELSACGLGALAAERAVCTVTMARQRFPGAQVSLDALCRRFEIDNSARSFHGHLLDCELLADVYRRLCGGRQPGLVERQSDVLGRRVTGRLDRGGGVRIKNNNE